MRRIPRTFSIGARCTEVFLGYYRAERLRGSSILIGQSGQEVACSIWEEFFVR
jgi:hypothetical protein